MMKRTSSLLLLGALAFSAAPAKAQTTWHVDGAASTSGNGLSWASPVNRLEKAFGVALPGDSIWVKEGHYRPALRTDMSDPRTATFFVPQGVRMFGGFAGNETSLAQRAGLFDQTILDGDIGVPGDDSDNAYHVVTMLHPSGIPPGATWVNGFRIQGARDAGQGGGIYSFNSASRVENCIITDNEAMTGAGVHCQPASLRLYRCTFRDNTSTGNGGAVWGQALSLRVAHCKFERNRSATKGGAIYVHSVGSVEAVHVDNSLFVGNAANAGGAIFFGGGQFASGKGRVSNSTFFGNHAATVGGALRAVTGPQIPADGRLYNCVVWGNDAPTGDQLGGRWTVNHCDVQGGAVAGQNNISQNPMFVDPGAGDFRLAPGSPCIDAGNNNFLAPDFGDIDDDNVNDESVPLDFALAPRVVDDPATADTGTGSAPLVDMGAFER